MKNRSLLQQGNYSPGWIRDFYDQTGLWWGPGTENPDEDRARAAAINRLCGPGPKRVLELGCGAGHSAAATAKLGHTVVGVDLSPRRIRQAKDSYPDPLPGPLVFVEGDFYTLELEGRFDVVTYWDGFGVQSDADHRRLLRRIAGEWLAPVGSVLLDVASSAWAARHAGEEMRLDPLEGVPGSVEMLRRWHYDVLHARWIDEWVPTSHPEEALEQTIRCYTPADFQLLLEGTGLALKYIEVNGQLIELSPDKIAASGPLLEAYSFRARLAAE